MTLRPTALGCTHIAAIEHFTDEGRTRWGESREQNYGSAAAQEKQWRPCVDQVSTGEILELVAVPVRLGSRGLSLPLANSLRRRGQCSGRVEIRIVKHDVALKTLHAVTVALAGNCSADLRFRIFQGQGLLADHFVNEVRAG